MDALIAVFSVALWISAVVALGLSIGKGLAVHAKKVAIKRYGSDEAYDAERELLAALTDEDLEWLSRNGWHRAMNERSQRKHDAATPKAGPVVLKPEDVGALSPGSFMIPIGRNGYSRHRPGSALPVLGCSCDECCGRPVHEHIAAAKRYARKRYGTEGEIQENIRAIKAEMDRIRNELW